MKFFSIVGARPQFIKLAPLSRVLRKYHDELIIHTGQHYDDKMSSSFFKDLDIPYPDYNLNIGSGPHGSQTGLMVVALEDLLLKDKPDAVIVFGDTNSTLAGALAAAKLEIKIIHVEAGLRSFNRSMPEEINRVLTDHASDYLFAPTQTAMYNLGNEGLKEKAFLTGDIMADSIKTASESKNDVMSLNQNYALLTLHRPYNVDSPEKLSKILRIVGNLDDSIIFPAHPRTKNMIEGSGVTIPENIIMIDPVGYFESINLQKNSNKIFTDSGGVQKEAYILRKPCFTFRPETEWVETVESGWNVLLNPEFDEDFIIQRIVTFREPDEYSNLFGVNVASEMLRLINSIFS